MINKVLLLSSGLVLSLSFAEAALASPWFLAGCPKENQQKSAQTREELMRARPGDPNYVPHPYPKTPQEAFQDFVYQFQDSWSRQSWDATPAQERALLNFLEEKAIRYQVLKVAEWRAQRCSRTYGKKDSLFLLRLFDDTRRAEVARVTLLDNGIMATLDFPPEDGHELQLVDGHRLETFDQAVQAAKRLGIEPKELQYVAVGSPKLACYDSIPCIAFRQANRAFLYRSGQVFELLHDRVQISNEKFVRATPERDEVVKKLKPRDQVVSLGGDAMTIATPLD